jgi:hypothetical protein
MISSFRHLASLLFMLAVTSDALRSADQSMRRVTSRMISVDELLHGVVDTPVTTKRPHVLNNIYFGLRHGIYLPIYLPTYLPIYRFLKVAITIFLFRRVRSKQARRYFLRPYSRLHNTRTYLSRQVPSEVFCYSCN